MNARKIDYFLQYKNKIYVLIVESCTIDYEMIKCDNKRRVQIFAIRKEIEKN